MLANHATRTRFGQLRAIKLVCKQLPPSRKLCQAIQKKEKHREEAANPPKVFLLCKGPAWHEILAVEGSVSIFIVRTE